MIVEQFAGFSALTILTSIALKGILMGGLVAPNSAPVAGGVEPTHSQTNPIAQIVQSTEATPAPAVSALPALNIPSQVVALRRAIIGQESANNFRAVNPHSGALGYGQVMPFNLPSWSQDALGYSVNREQYLNSPEIQLRVIDYRLMKYWQDAMVTSGGDEAIAVRQVAARWYSGNPHRYTSTVTQYYNGHRYPSIADYSISVLRRYRQQLSLIAANPNAS